MLISSRNNPTIKQIRALRERKERERSGLFFAEGLHLVTEAVQVGERIETLIVAPELLASAHGQEIVARARQNGAACLEVTAEVYNTLSMRENFQGIGAVMRQKWERLETVRLGAELCWVALDAVQYPGNLGTILRTCEAVGGGGAILIGNTADPYDPTAVRASTGAVFTQRLVRTSFASFAAWKETQSYVVVGTSPSAVEDYQTVCYRPPVVLYMGCERAGLSQEEQTLCDVMVRIPMVGRTDSLNLAVATGIVLCEIFNQRRSAKISALHT